MTARPVAYATPTSEPLTIDLRVLLDEAVGGKAALPSLRQMLWADEGLLAALLDRMAGRLPHWLVLVLDQAEEMFTVSSKAGEAAGRYGVPVRAEDETAGRDRALSLLARVAELNSDVKVIVSLRTEYYGRLLDHLRAGRRAARAPG